MFTRFAKDFICFNSYQVRILLTNHIFVFCAFLTLGASQFHIAGAEESASMLTTDIKGNTATQANTSPLTNSSSKILQFSDDQSQKLNSKKGSQESVFDASQAELLILEFNFNRYILSDGVLGYLYDGRLYLPIGEVAQILDFAINVDTSREQAVGWFLEENRQFFIDVKQGKAVVEGKTYPFDPNSVFIDEDIFIDSKLLGSWLPVRFEFDLSALLVNVTSPETLPFEARLKRENIYSRIKRTSKEKATYPHTSAPYNLLSWPAIDSSFDFNFDSDANKFSTDSSTRITGDFLYMNTEVFTSGNREDSLSVLRLKMGRQDPENQLLGSLKVSEFSIGDIFSPQIPLVANSKPGAGFQISSFPLLQEAEFDRINLRGEQQVGWEVELYRNEVLLDVQTEPNADGRYEFLDVPLLFGSNIVRVVLIGPQGQRREKVQRYNVGLDQAPPGKSYFRFSTTFQNKNLFEVTDNEDITPSDGDNEARYIAEFQRGINHHLSLTGNFSSLALDGKRHYFGTLGLRTGLGGALSRFDVTTNGDGGTALEAAVLTNLKGVSVFLEHTRFYDFQSERETNQSDSIDSRSNFRLESSLPSFGFIPRIPWSLTGDFEQRKSGVDQIDLSNRLSVFMMGVAASNTFDWSHSYGGSSSSSTESSGSFQLSGRLMELKLRSSLNYSVSPDSKLSSTSISSDFSLSPDFSVNLGLTKQLEESKLTIFNAGLNRRFESFAIGFNTTFDDGGSFFMGSSLTFSLGREPRTGNWVHSSDRVASTGMVSARVFIDANGNQVFDKGDTPLENAKFKQGNQKTNKDGIALLTGLSIARPIDIVLDTSSLEDPFLVPVRKGYEVLARPGRPLVLDFPVSLTGEIDGIAFLITHNSEKAVSNVHLQLVDTEQNVVAETKSEFDGFYLFQMVPMGKYSIRVAADQEKRLNLKPLEPQGIVIEEADPFKAGINLPLKQKSSK
jgi:hypothetical protein